MPPDTHVLLEADKSINRVVVRVPGRAAVIVDKQKDGNFKVCVGVCVCVCVCLLLLMVVLHSFVST